MFEAVGKKVIYLKRLSMGPLQLDETLMPGEYRELTEKEKDTLCSVEKSSNFRYGWDTDGFHVDLAGSGPDLFKEIPSDPAARIRQGIGGKSYTETAQYFLDVFPELSCSLEDVQRSGSI